MVISKAGLLSLSCLIIFIISQFLTLNRYSVSWDETIHFRRGHAYLYYFLTGEKNYNKLPKYNFQGKAGDPDKIPLPRRSFYQDDLQNGEWFFNKDVGHPPLNGILAAFSNYIFFQKLGLINDIESHHIFNVISASMAVGAVVYIISKYYNLKAGFISFLALLTYPLWWAESHFNVKDPAIAGFWSASIVGYLEYLEVKKIKYLILGFIFFTLGIGTKLNIIFLPLVLLVYFVISKKYKLSNIKALILIFISMVLGLILIYALWPYLWLEFPNHILEIFGFYKNIGTKVRYQPDYFFFFGLNTYPILWIVFTTPLVTLFLASVGIISANKYSKNFPKIGYLVLLWLFLPIIRVVLPNTSIYGGIRQIMEYIPAIAALAGIGAFYLFRLFKNYKNVLFIFFVLLYILSIKDLVKISPYGNVYFNSLIGGLPGAYNNAFPSWGNTFGTAYKEAIRWININAAYNSKLSLLQGTPSNIPTGYIREDINYLVDDNINSTQTHFSGIKREGEYLIELTHGDAVQDFYYAWDYVNNFLNPVYEVKVDGVTLAKVWENDIENTKEQYKLIEQKRYPSSWYVNDNFIQIELDKSYLLSNIVIKYIKSCRLTEPIEVYTSLDSKLWLKQKDIIPQYQLYRSLNYSDLGINYFFAGNSAKFIKLVSLSNNSCIINTNSVELFILK